jgi:hypothetical protein
MNRATTTTSDDTVASTSGLVVLGVVVTLHAAGTDNPIPTDTATT